MSGPRRGAVSGRLGSKPSRREGFRTMALVLVGGMTIAGLVLAVFTVGAETWSPPEIAPETVVARVHDEPVTWAAVAEQLEAAEVMGRPQPHDLATWRSAVQANVDSIVGDVLTRHFMESQGVTVTDEAIDAEVAKVRQSSGGEDGFRSAMAGMRVSMAQLRETKRRGLYLQAMIDHVVPVAAEADIDAYLARPDVGDVSRAEAAVLVRREAESQVLPGIMTQLRADPGVWVIDVTSLG